MQSKSNEKNKIKKRKPYNENRKDKTREKKRRHKNTKKQKTNNLTYHVNPTAKMLLPVSQLWTEMTSLIQ